jgi:hypothetical protein
VVHHFTIDLVRDLQGNGVDALAGTRRARRHIGTALRVVFTIKFHVQDVLVRRRVEAQAVALVRGDDIFVVKMETYREQERTQGAISTESSTVGPPERFASKPGKLG